MDTITFYLLVICALLRGSYAITSNFLATLCTTTVGPTYGEHIMYHKAQNGWNRTLQYYTQDTDLDCWLHLKGQQRTSNQATYKVALGFKNQFSVKGYDYGTVNKAPVSGNVTGTDCETGYMEIYNATDTGKVIGGPIAGPVCGQYSPGAVDIVGSNLVIHVFVAALPEWYYSTTPAPTTPAVTLDPNATTVVPTTPRQLAPVEICLMVGKCPQVRFNIDFTSYVAFGCYEDGIFNEGSQVFCLLTERCIDVSLLCDGQNSNNCGDWSDQVGNACIRPAKPAVVIPPYDFTPIIIAVSAGVAGLVLLYYCFWRPGYLPWRLARLRNTRFGRVAGCCRSCCRKGPCGSIGCCKPTKGKWRKFATTFHTQTESKFPDLPPDPNKVRKLPMAQRMLGKTWCCRKKGWNYDDKGNMIHGGPWMNFSSGDGMHIRETR